MLIPTIKATAKPEDASAGMAIIDVGDDETLTLLAPQRVIEQGGQHGAVALALQRVALGRVEQLARLVIAEGRGLTPILFI